MVPYGSCGSAILVAMRPLLRRTVHWGVGGLGNAAKILVSTDQILARLYELCLSGGHTRDGAVSGRGWAASFDSSVSHRGYKPTRVCKHGVDAVFTSGEPAADAQRSNLRCHFFVSMAKAS
ncbi:hypothetical protein ACWPM1_13385 [Tsuneonella sp. HG249]